MELWDLYDKKGNFLGRTHECGKPLQEGEYHLVVQVWIVGRSGRILITQRQSDILEGGLWSVPGGAVKAGETNRQGAVRGLKEEIGLDVHTSQLTYLGRQIDGEYLMDSFLLARDILIKELVLQSNKVTEVKLIYLHELELMKQCDTFAENTWERFQKYREGILSHLFFEIEQASPAEAGEIIKAKENAFHTDLVMYNRKPDFNQWREEEENLLGQPDADRYAYVCRDRETGEIIGGVNGKLLNKKGFYIKCIYIIKSYQNKSIGGLLLDYLEKEFPHVIFWHTLIAYKSKQQRHFFEKFGYVEVEAGKPEEDGFYYVHYRKDVEEVIMPKDEETPEEIPFEVKEEEKLQVSETSPKDGMDDAREDKSMNMASEEQGNVYNPIKETPLEESEKTSTVVSKPNVHFFEFREGKWCEAGER